MPEGVDTFVEDGYATISVRDKDKRGQVLNTILEHTPPELVQKNSRTGPHVTYTVPEGNARDAGLIDGEGEKPVGDRWDSGNSEALTQAYEQEKADSHHIVTPGVKEDAYAAVSQRTVQDADVNNPVPEDSNGIITGPLRPNKRVEDAPPVPEGASTTAADLQAKIRAATPYPADYAPEPTPVDERVPSGVGTIATVVAAPSEPAEQTEQKAPAKKAPAKKAPAKKAASK